jgi:hypothetical protein
VEQFGSLSCAVRGQDLYIVNDAVVTLPSYDLVNSYGLTQRVLPAAYTLSQAGTQLTRSRDDTLPVLSKPKFLRTGELRLPLDTSCVTVRLCVRHIGSHVTFVVEKDSIISIRLCEFWVFAVEWQRLPFVWDVNMCLCLIGSIRF